MVFRWILVDQFSVNGGLGEPRPKQQRNYARNQMILEETCLWPEVLFCLITPLSSSSHITHMEIKIYMLMVLINLRYDEKIFPLFPVLHFIVRQLFYTAVKTVYPIWLNCGAHRYIIGTNSAGWLHTCQCNFIGLLI